MTVREVTLKTERLERIADRLRSGEDVDKGLLADYLTEYVALLYQLPVNIDV